MFKPGEFATYNLRIFFYITIIFTWWLCAVSHRNNIILHFIFWYLLYKVGAIFFLLIAEYIYIFFILKIHIYICKVLLLFLSTLIHCIYIIPWNLIGCCILDGQKWAKRSSLETFSFITGKSCVYIDFSKPLTLSAELIWLILRCSRENCLNNQVHWRNRKLCMYM